MSNFDSDGGGENQWDDRGELAWNEFDWERYLRGQEESIRRYLSLYEAARGRPDRLDHVAVQMGWETTSQTDEATEDDSEATAEPADELAGVYTLHQNPIYIATRAIYLTLWRSWLRLASQSGRVPQPLAVAFLSSLHRGEATAIEAIHALDYGDFAMAVSLFKRALGLLNQSFGLLQEDSALRHAAVVAWREDALPRCFDLREIWLRVIADCRAELNHPADDDES